MHPLEGKVVEASFADELASRQEHVAVLLNMVVPMGPLNLVAVLFYVRPAPFHVERRVERKLFVNHTVAVVGPHVVEAQLGQSGSPVIDVAVAHMGIREHHGALFAVLLHQRKYVGHGLLFDAVDHLDFGAATKHAEHPPNHRHVALAVVLLVVHLGLVDLDRASEHQVGQHELGDPVGVGLAEQCEVGPRVARHELAFLGDHARGVDGLAVHHPHGEAHVEVADVDCCQDRRLVY